MPFKVNNIIDSNQLHWSTCNIDRYIQEGGRMYSRIAYSIYTAFREYKNEKIRLNLVCKPWYEICINFMIFKESWKIVCNTML